jgi:hypothetical protein
VTDRDEGEILSLIPVSKLETSKSRLKGMRLRDEFVCPITYELLREPVVACDGNTYEKNAIVTWFKTHNTSPRNGEIMGTGMISNMNLKKLIMDLINEGGAGLYTTDQNYESRLIDVCPQRILVLRCLGPPESDWNGRTFDVNRFMSCIFFNNFGLFHRSVQWVAWEDENNKMIPNLSTKK